MVLGSIWFFDFTSFSDACTDTYTYYLHGILIDTITLFLNASASVANTPVTATIWYCLLFTPLGSFRMLFKVVVEEVTFALSFARPNSDIFELLGSRTRRRKAEFPFFSTSIPAIVRE